MTPTVRMRDRVEAVGYQFLQDAAGWALYDLDDRSEVPGTRAKMYGDSIWAAASVLGLEHEEGEQDGS
jgi:hypothetical protein